MIQDQGDIPFLFTHPRNDCLMIAHMIQNPQRSRLAVYARVHTLIQFKEARALL